jgi:hypothetical protein
VFCAASWNAMKPMPRSVALTKSAGIPGKATGSTAEMPIATEPNSIGRRAPIRSTSRPAGTDRNIGSSAYSEISTPTVNAEAPRDSASSETITLLPVRTA